MDDRFEIEEISTTNSMAVTSGSFNNVNELTSQSGNGEPVKFRGTLEVSRVSLESEGGFLVSEAAGSVKSLAFRRLVYAEL